jgi:hypothetical protein
MSAIGFLIFINLSADDFLSPGFVVKGILLQGTQVAAQESVSIPFQINDVKPITLLVSASDAPVAFNIQVDGPRGIVYHDSDLIKSSLTFTPDSIGDYIVTVKNLSSKTTVVNISEGYVKNYENMQVILVILSMFMIIGGNYLIVNNYFFSLRNYS